MAFPGRYAPSGANRLRILAFLVVAFVAAAAAFLAVYIIGGDDGGVEAQTVREYNLEVVATDIDYGNGNVWHAWTYKLADDPAGTVPGPTLHVNVGEKLVVNVDEQAGHRAQLSHALHELRPGVRRQPAQHDHRRRRRRDDPAGRQWTYEFEPTEPGIFYYHCHSADGGRHITQHIHQGLYGAIVVMTRTTPPVRDEVHLHERDRLRHRGRQRPAVHHERHGPSRRRARAGGGLQGRWHRCGRGAVQQDGPVIECQGRRGAATST